MGKTLEGRPIGISAIKTATCPPHDETGHTWHHSDQDLFEMTKYGVGTFAGEGYKTRMPIYRDTLSDSEILAVLSFIKSRWPTEVIQIHNEQVNSSQ